MQIENNVFLNFPNQYATQGFSALSKSLNSQVQNAITPTSSTIVTLSSAATANSNSNDNANDVTLPPIQQQIINQLNNSSPSWAMQTVQDVATNPDSELVNISHATFGPNGIQGVVYTNNGEPVTSQSSAQFATLAQQVLTQKTAIFEQGKAEGLSAGQIYTKIQDYMATQPQWYLQQMDWNGSTAQT
ncbi:hypothetical protein [Solimicrobium silvestre]|uniref:Uncharacterized protein n=1 Tax=Solimicrobium silvestre TaxID=2099400 RepID=A0A2S9GVU3_9BURK|nr:hypothetical protein [Solimicrobium silvestre]PRC91845.1 hypothetical protein S2091_3401 [Solimicrobium silvestre]